jgi:Bacterial SH3 domain
MASESTSPRAGRRRVLPACLALLLAAGCVAWALQQVTVKVPKLQIRKSVTNFGGIAAVAKQNETLEVLGRQGDWLKVRTAGGQEGFIKEAALTARTLAPSATFNVPGDASTSGADATAATKGIEPAALDFGRAKGYSTDGVERMIQTHRSITPEEFAAFVAEGGINPGR